MRQALISLAGFVALIGTPALAADLAVKAPPQTPAVCAWCGWYFGFNAGYGRSEYSDKFALPPPGTFSGLDPQGGFGGAQIGYNWQNADFVFGLEADIEGADINAQATDPVGNFFKSRVDYFGTVRGRLGYAFGPSLLYATGGFAYGHVENVANSAGGPTPFAITRTAPGYVAGGGYEYKFSPTLSFKAEYQFINLGRNDPVNPVSGSACSFGPKCEADAFHTFRLGMNYHIGAPIRP